MTQPLSRPAADRFLSSLDVAWLLRFNSETICCYARSGRLAGVKVGGRWRFEREDVHTFLGDCGQVTDAQIDARLAREAQAAIPLNGKE